MKSKLYTVVLVVDATINFLIGSQQIYNPNAKAGARLASGTQEHCEWISQQYTKAGYETYVECSSEEQQYEDVPECPVDHNNRLVLRSKRESK